MTRSLLLEWADQRGVFSTPTSPPKGNTPKGNITPIERERSLLFPSEKQDIEEIRNLTKSIVGIFYNSSDRAFKIKDIVTLIESWSDVNKGSVKQIIYRLKKIGLIRRLPHHYYILKEKDQALEYLQGNRVPYKGGHPDSSTPYHFEQKGNIPNDTLPDTGNESIPLKTHFHHIRFKHVKIKPEIFSQMRNDGRLIRAKNAKSRQWRYYGSSYEIHISEKTFIAWGSLRKIGWQQEFILDFGPEAYAQLIHAISAHCAIEDLNKSLSFIENNDSTSLKVSFDGGSDLGTDEIEFEGPIDQISTLKMFFIDPVGSMNKLTKLEECFQYLAKCQGDLVSVAISTKDELSEIKDKIDNITIMQHPNDDIGGIEYHR